MVSSFVSEIDTSATAVPSFSAPAGEKEGPMSTFLLIGVSAVLGFLCLTGPDGVGGTKYRPEFGFQQLQLDPIRGGIKHASIRDRRTSN